MALFPADELEALLILKARNGESISYGDVFRWFGLPFVRFQVGQLCAALEEVDSRQRAQDRPVLASLVVRQSDGLPGQGWWLSKDHDGWEGPFTGPRAARFVKRHQQRCFDHWQDPPPPKRKARIPGPAGAASATARPQRSGGSDKTGPAGAASATARPKRSGGSGKTGPAGAASATARPERSGGEETKPLPAGAASATARPQRSEGSGKTGPTGAASATARPQRSEGETKK
ncbi:hypothetical protein [Sandaracinobacter sp.]|uniref:hypothetical protein n=1 Tax=Sandaracinobacter sp. TaxID=2487581 RepID=UPI0035B0BE60